ncbi:MAG: DNA mismatch endonuclease Vsr [Gammaproteobacteria bacterium]|nr:DNA mismatch endonuclease Vsr [Gammaproteobacteria bacterium]
MTDTVDAATRSRIMAGVGSANTKPELQLRHMMHARGFRYRLHDRSLPGSPDLVFRRYQVACFVHGCFWHQHPGCSKARIPSSRREYWVPKFERNVARDLEVRQALGGDGWRVAIVWECALTQSRVIATVDEFASWLCSDQMAFETPIA